MYCWVISCLIQLLDRLIWIAFWLAFDCVAFCIVQCTSLFLGFDWHIYVLLFTNHQLVKTFRLMSPRLPICLLYVNWLLFMTGLETLTCFGALIIRHNLIWDIISILIVSIACLKQWLFEGLIKIFYWSAVISAFKWILTLILIDRSTYIFQTIFLHK